METKAIVLGHERIGKLFTVAAVIYRKTIENQGCSMNLAHQEPVSGYMIGHKGTEVRINILDFNAGHVDSFIRNNLSKLFNHKLFIGTWIEGDEVFIDISQNLQNRRAAIAFAQDNGQIAIYNVPNKLTIYIL